MNDYEDSRIKKIIRPQISCKPFPEWCDGNSPAWVRRPIVQLRRYLAMECNCGFSWDTSDDGWKNVSVKTFSDDSHSYESKHSLIGFAAFNTDDDPFLSAVWIHPFYRNRGLLKRAWPEFVSRFGAFEVDWPSKQMLAILQAVGHQQSKPCA